MNANCIPRSKKLFGGVFYLLSYRLYIRSRKDSFSCVACLIVET